MSVTKVTNEALRGYRHELQAAGRSKGTIEVRLCHIRRALTDIGKVPTDVTRRDLIEWMASRDLAPSTRRGLRASLRSFFDWLASETGTDSVAARLPTVPIPRAVPRPASDYAIAEALNSAPEWVALAIEVMATCGLRRAECATLRSDDVQAVGQGWILRVTGKGGHERLIPCPPLLAKRLKRCGGWVFPGGQCGHVSPGWLGKQVSRYMDSGLTAHTLRHRYASVAYNTSHDLRAVQTLLGHASVATTQIYTSIDDGMVRSVASVAWKIVT